MFSDEELLPISALQHLLFCERQCALIHLERLWAENVLTVQGRQLHRRAHGAPVETRGSRRVARGLPLRSFRLGLTGQSDVVEFERLEAAGPVDWAALATSPEQFATGVWRVTPVEYKRGRPKQNDCDRVQLCAQALCLEEMLGLTISVGALFYGERKRRTPVEIDGSLRQTTETAVRRLHEVIASGVTPRAIREPKCDRCSLVHLCLPDALAHGPSVAGRVRRDLLAALRATAPVADPSPTASSP